MVKLDANNYESDGIPPNTGHIMGFLTPRESEEGCRDPGASHERCHKRPRNGESPSCELSPIERRCERSISLH